MRAFRVTRRETGEALDLAAPHLGDALQLGSRHFGTDVGLTIEPLTTDIRHLIPHPQTVIMARKKAQDVEIIDIDHPDLPQPPPQPTVEEQVAERVALVRPETFDAEAGKWVPVTPEMEAMEERMRQAWGMSKLVQAVVVREVYDRKLYLAAGYETRADYCRQVLDIDKRTAENYYRMATRFADFLPQVAPPRLLQSSNPSVSDAKTFSHNGGDDNRKTFSGPVEITQPDGEAAATVQALGISKLYELMKVEDDDLDVLLRGETVTTSTGREISLSELRDASVRQASAMVKQLKDEYRAKLQRDQERAAQAEAERDVYRERAEASEAELERLRELERIYGPRAAVVEGQFATLDRVRRLVRDLSRELDYVHEYEVDELDEVPEALKREILGVLRSLNGLAQHFGERMATVSAQF